MSGKRDARGFTLVEILVALSILAIVMTILHGAFSVSAVTARVVDERADHLASLTGALDTLGHEVRGAYGWLPGPNTRITFTTMAPFHEDAAPQVQTVSYEFSDGTLLRKVFRTREALSPLR